MARRNIDHLALYRNDPNPQRGLVAIARDQDNDMAHREAARRILERVTHSITSLVDAGKELNALLDQMGVPER